METFGRRVRASRLAQFERSGEEMTQEELAERLGLTKAAVSTWENDINSPPVAAIPGIAEILGVTPEWLAWGRGERYAAPPSAEDAPGRGVDRIERGREVLRETAVDKAARRKRRTS